MLCTGAIFVWSLLQAQMQACVGMQQHLDRSASD